MPEQPVLHKLSWLHRVACRLVGREIVNITRVAILENGMGEVGRCQERDDLVRLNATLESTDGLARIFRRASRNRLGTLCPAFCFALRFAALPLSNTSEYCKGWHFNRK